MEKEHNLKREKYVVSLLGYKLVPSEDNVWLIENQEGKVVGETLYETPPYVEPTYHTHIHVNGTVCDDQIQESSNSQYYHYEFHENGYTIVIMNFDNEEEKEIQLWHHPLEGGIYLYQLRWNPSYENSGFLIGKTTFLRYDKRGYCSPENEIIEYSVNKPNLIKYNGREYKVDILGTEAVDFFGEMDQIMKGTLFVKSFEEIIGERDVAVTGMDNVLDMARQINSYREENTQKKR